MSGGTREEDASRVLALRQGLAEIGHDEDRNVAFDYRGAAGQYDRLPALATELVRSQVAVIATLGPTLSALAAKAATATVPVVFNIGADAVRVGLVASLNRPGGNVTGVSQLGNVIVAKQFELLREAVPRAGPIGFLVNPANSNAASDTSDAQAAAQALGQKLVVVQARTQSELESALQRWSSSRPVQCCS